MKNKEIFSWKKNVFYFVILNTIILSLFVVFYEYTRISLFSHSESVFISFFASYFIVLLKKRYNDADFEFEIIISEAATGKASSFKAALSCVYQAYDFHRKSSIFVFFIIIIITTLVCVFVVYAGQISALDRNYNDENARIVSLKEELSQNLDRRLSYRDNIIQKNISELDKFKSDKRSENEINSLIKKHEIEESRIKSEINALDSQYRLVFESLLAALNESRKNAIESNKIESRLISTTVLRISVGAIATFLIYILLGYYKYNSRLAATYLARFNALCILEPTDPKFESVLEALTAERVPLGKDPKSALEEVRQFLSSFKATQPIEPKNSSP